MGQILYGCATTTKAVRRAIQHSQESLMVLAVRYGINPKTVAKWRKWAHVTDARLGPKEVRSTVLTPEEETAILAFVAPPAANRMRRACKIGGDEPAEEMTKVRRI